MAGPMREGDAVDLDLPSLHGRALVSARTYVAAVASGSWGAPTPCDGWDVRELVNHLVAGNLWAGELMAGRSIDEVGDRLDGDVLGPDPLAELDRSAAIADAAFSAPGAMRFPAAVSYGPVPGSVYCGHRFIEALIHGWDVAVATGQDATLDPELVAACTAVVVPQADMLAGSGAFDVDVEASAGAGPQTVLLALLGRRG